jgi:methionyl-tRNA formyltransferase
VGAHVELQDGLVLGVTEARALPHGTGAPGVLVVSGEDGPRIACGRGELQLLRVKPPGRKEMTGLEWLRGYKR